MRVAFRYSSALMILMMTAGCIGPQSSSSSMIRSVCDSLPDTIRVATLYSPTSFFYFRDLPMGYDYELMTRIAEQHDIALDWHIAPSLAAAVSLLDSGKVHMIAYGVPVTSEYRDHVIHCGANSVSHQVLVQPARHDTSYVSDVTQLIGREVFVEKGSRYHARLINLDEELGGGIKIREIDRDTIITEDLIEMVADGRIPMTIVDSDIALLNHTYFPGIDVSLPVSLDQRVSWGVSPSFPWLADSIEAWTSGESPDRIRSELLRRYFELSKRQPLTSEINFSNGRVSPYDELFRKYAPEAGLDWRIIAAQAFIESRFDPSVVSWAGARGLMQIMPSTARALGVNPGQLADCETSVRTAARIISQLDHSLSSKVPDQKERVKFIVAAYNSGLAHILDAIALAGVIGLDPTKWNGNVEEALLLKANPDYYNNPVVKYGYFRGRQTTEYVRSVMQFYSRACQAVKD